MIRKNFRIVCQLPDWPHRFFAWNFICCTKFFGLKIENRSQSNKIFAWHDSHDIYLFCFFFAFLGTLYHFNAGGLCRNIRQLNIDDFGALGGPTFARLRLRTRLRICEHTMWVWVTTASLPVHHLIIPCQSINTSRRPSTHICAYTYIGTLRGWATLI